MRTGSVVAREGDLHQVRWEDSGAEEEVYLGDYEHAVGRGSVEHLALVGHLEAVFADDPLAVVLRLLGDTGTPMNGRQIKAHLLGRGVPQTVWEQGWAKIRQVLPGHAGVESVGDKGTRTFAWVGDPQPALPVPAPAPSPVATPAPAASPALSSDPDAASELASAAELASESESQSHEERRPVG